MQAALEKYCSTPCAIRRAFTPRPCHLERRKERSDDRSREISQFQKTLSQCAPITARYLDYGPKSGPPLGMTGVPFIKAAEKTPIQTNTTSTAAGQSPFHTRGVGEILLNLSLYTPRFYTTALSSRPEHRCFSGVEWRDLLAPPVTPSAVLGSFLAGQAVRRTLGCAAYISNQGLIQESLLQGLWGKQYSSVT